MKPSTRPDPERASPAPWLLAALDRAGAEGAEREILAARWSAEAARNRELMPEVTAFIDAMREIDPTLVVRWAFENGHEVGRRPPDVSIQDLA